MISISEINIVPVKPKDGLLGFVSFVVDESFYMGNITIYSKLNGGIRLVYPKKGEIYCLHPIQKKVGRFLETLVQEKFNEILIDERFKTGDF